MITVERVYDMDAIRKIVTAPEVYSHISDDGSAKAEDFTPADSEQVIYLGVKKDGDLRGVFAYIPQNAACIEVHTCLTRSLWGHSCEAAKESVKWIWENTRFVRIMTNVPTYNRLAMKLAVKAGMKKFGQNPRSFLKGGVLYDLVMMGISKESICH